MDRIGLLLFAALLGGMASPAATGKETTSALTKDVVATVVEKANRIVTTYYLYPEKVPEITGRLKASLASGRYRVSDPAALAARMTEDLQAVTHDGHMSVTYAPDATAAASAAQPASGDSAQPSLSTADVNIGKMEVLPGNIRYVEVKTFQWSPQSSPTAFDHAVSFLRGGDAYILDVRDNPGGDPEAVTYLVSHFMEPGRHLMTFYSKEGSTQSKTLGQLAARRLEPKPLLLLISKATFSAAEEFAAHVKHFKLGTIIGEASGGGGNNNTLVGTREGFLVSVSSGRAIHAATGKSWQGEGIAPDIKVPAAKALEVAELSALERTRAAHAKRRQ
jgi:hypothetical protein